MKLIIALLAFSGFAFAQPSVGGCPIFPSTNFWNVPVDTLAVHPNSLNIVNSIGPGAGLHIDNELPINLAAAGTPTVQMSTSNTESDLGPWPMPAGAVIESTPNKHLIVIDQGTCILYEAFLAVNGGSTWTAGSIAKWDLRSNALRPAKWTSADGAGLPMTAGILRYAEVTAGEVKHALGVSALVTYGPDYAWPARHVASSSTDPNVPKMGQRLRLKAGFVISGFTPQQQVILQGLKKYGVVVTDNGPSWGMPHDQDTGWGSINLAALNTILGSSMEVVDASVLMTDVDSGTAVVPAPLGLLMTDLLGRKNSVSLGSGLSIVNGTIVASGGTSAVTHVAGRTGDVILGIPDITDLSTSLSTLTTQVAGKQPLLTYTPEQVLSFSSPLSRSGTTISCPTCSTSSGNHSGTATFSASPNPDTATLGSWKGVYGAGGYQIVGDTIKLPIYATLTPVGNQTVTWANTTSDSRGLQKAGNGRVAAAWYTPNGMAIDVNIADGQTHKVSLYFVDWDLLARSEKVEITDLQGNVLDTRTVSGFSGGEYLAWNISGHVVIRLTKTAGTPAAATAVVSGIFFDN